MISPLAGKPIKVLVVDDDPLFHRLIVPNISKWGYVCESVTDRDSAMLALQQAEEDNSPFSIVTVDMNFVVGKTEMPLGKTLPQEIKSQYPYIACIMISGSGVSAHEVLDLRDDYNIDYYIAKDRFDPDTFNKGIKRALERVRPLGNVERQRELLLETLERYKDLWVIYRNNLAMVELKKAQKGIDVSVDIENQIEIFQRKLGEAAEKIREIEQEIKRLSAD